MEEDKIEQLRFELSLQFGMEFTRNQALSLWKVISDYDAKIKELKTDDEIYNEGIDKGVDIGSKYAIAMIDAIR
ncbi:hypothetical protein ACRCJU_02815 [Aerococcus urinaeequi]|uniref:hypothetical protein n=1 Tax=Aerococcus urinaeequi TaxID=51665 RepID=UPI003D6BFAA3